MNIIAKLKAWLRLFRAHTLVLEAPMAVLGAAIGLGTLFDWRVCLWLIFGGAYHYIGYGMNSYVDWKKGFDKDDERKQHHPLNTGEIEPYHAKYAIYGLLVGLLLFLFIMTFQQPKALILSGVMVASGILYNYFGKYTSLKAIPISIAHTLVFFIPYYLYTEQVEQYVILITAAYFIHHFYQISISGDIKDIDQDEASLIQTLGATVYKNKYEGVDYLATSNKVLIMAYGLTIAQMFLAYMSMYITNSMGVTVLVGAIFGALTVYESDKMLQPGKFKRSTRLEHISRREFFGYSTVHSASIIVIGLQNFVVLLVCMLVYLGLVSKFIWGNWLVPEV